ncbi:D-aminoacylase [Variovorax sp. J22G73]|uniref:N-acyl-D-amino-acid deacylase family protein n=1 Tax=unclassified Variovorax TaxID=663243 RepID=UPI002574B84A|nr:MULTISPECIES: D-aminoacylase [unclassified Variovorax]MDM0005200.1 D-aminoacylase [Variovorax sp. J22R203]MDM0098616.1 D-aminoacylase [Variovorax sp. J22G73]
MFDLIIEGGTVIDGTGAPRLRADVAIAQGRVAAIGALSALAARERFDARGRIVAPGFIDVHTHDDRLLLDTPVGAHPKLSQGVTTVVTGNCGVSLAPLQAATSPPAPLDLLGTDAWRFARFGDYLDELEASGPAVNAACLVGHSTLRVRHMDRLDREATSHEAQRMAGDLADALVAGAIGMSTGLYYPPARAASTQEVVAVGAPLTGAGGVITMHIRDESDAIDEALREALLIGRTLGVDTVLSHHKLVGKANHGRSVQTLAMIEQAAEGQPVCFDCYPYNASSTMLLPGRVAQSDDVRVTWSKADASAAGQSLFVLARERGVTPEQLAQDLQPAGAIYFAMSEADVSRILAHPMAMVGSDGLAHDVSPHPRLWGTFPRVLGHYVRERRLFSLEAAVHKMTGLSARRFGLRGRGVLAPGHHADVVVFDAHRVADRATFAHPTEVSAGIDAVFVNGRLACRDGRSLDVHAGRVLRHGRAD